MSEWISVEDRLPEIAEHVLAYYYPKSPAMEGRIIGIKHRFDLSTSPMFIKSKCDENGFGNCSKVTHWMPLPEPPNQ